MSVFKGLVKEFNGISVDNFHPQVKTYFLSHLHTDHTPGLSELEANDCKIYCSDITKNLLLASPIYTNIHSCVVGLPIGTNQKINVISCIPTFEDYILDVTLIPAGHCLGSVMFLFEDSTEKSLYTGDFRLDCGSAARMKALHNGMIPKKLSTIYADTTFFLPEIRAIPSRQAACDAVLKLCEDWLATSCNHVVRIVLKARYSYEYLLALLRQKFGMKVHVSHDCRNSYMELSEIQSDLTIYNNSTRIHACSYSDSLNYIIAKLTEFVEILVKRHFYSMIYVLLFTMYEFLRQQGDQRQLDRLPCGYKPENSDSPYSLLTILPTTLWFQDRASFGELVVRVNPTLIRVCFCFHSSYTEIVDFLTYLKPGRVLASVVPPGRTMEKVQADLDRLVLSWSNSKYENNSVLNLNHFPSRKRKRLPSSESSGEFIFGVSNKQNFCSNQEPKSKSPNASTSNSMECVDDIPNRKNGYSFGRFNSKESGIHSTKDGACRGNNTDCDNYDNTCNFLDCQSNVANRQNSSVANDGCTNYSNDQTLCQDNLTGVIGNLSDASDIFVHRDTGEAESSIDLNVQNNLNSRISLPNHCISLDIDSENTVSNLESEVKDIIFQETEISNDNISSPVSSQRTRISSSDNSIDQSSNSPLFTSHSNTHNPPNTSINKSFLFENFEEDECLTIDLTIDSSENSN